MKKNMFEPIAIVGQGCILPGALSPDALWNVVNNAQVVLSNPDENYWELSKEKSLSHNPGKYVANKAWSEIGGYIHGFDSLFDSSKYAQPKEKIDSLDVLFKWSLAAADQAFSSIKGMDTQLKQKTGVILGNLSYPSALFTALVEENALKILLPENKNQFSKINPLNRFMSGYPAEFIAKALNLGGPNLALDAACASSLYAIKIACDRLQSRESDCMLAGGVAGSDPLFIHVGFCALQAKSVKGISRPFHQEADGLIPSEGSAFVALKRLEDAQKDGDIILGVIRGIALNNDGNDGGFLAPSSKGQVLCMQNAFEIAGCTPEEVGLIECHATGTSVGDRTEFKSILKVFPQNKQIVLSSLKANLGHLITASGVAGLIKVLAAFKYEVLPPTPNAFPTFPEIKENGFRVLEKSEKWQPINNKYLACVSSFGFGGNNSHLILERYTQTEQKLHAAKNIEMQLPLREEMNECAVQSMFVRTHNAKNTQEFVFRLFGDIGGPVLDTYEQTATLPLNILGTSPVDLQVTLGQQLILMEAVQNAIENLKPINFSKMGIYIGMNTDTEVSMHGFKARLESLLAQAHVKTNPTWRKEVEEYATNDLNAGRVVGMMPNFPANRLSRLLGANGPGFTVSCEELSGIESLKIAIDALNRNEIDAAIVGAVDFCREEIHEKIIQDLFQNKYTKGADAAVVFVITRKKDAENPLAFINFDIENSGLVLSINSNPTELNSIDNIFGHAHAASGLLHLAQSVAMLQTKVIPGINSKKPVPSLELHNGASINLNLQSSFGMERKINILPTKLDNKQILPQAIERPAILTYAANTIEELIELVVQDKQTTTGNIRCAFVCYNHTREFERQQAIQVLKNIPQEKQMLQKANFSYCREPIQGKIASAFTGSASVYRNMDATLLMAFPELFDKLNPIFKKLLLSEFVSLLNNSHFKNTSFDQLLISSCIAQLHATFLREILRLQPDMTFGLSSGETNTILAYGIWDDDKTLFNELYDSGMYVNELTGTYESVRKHWGLSENEKINWESWVVQLPIEQIKLAVAEEKHLYITMILSSEDAVISGDPMACARILNQLGHDKAIRVEQDIAIHCPAVKPFEKIWRTLHTRKCKPNNKIRFYSNYLQGEYTPSELTVADALTGQAVNTIDFPLVAEKVWNDGARIFIEHGPRQSLTTYMSKIFKNRNYCAVSFDQQGTTSLIQAYRASASLWCAGVDVDISRLVENKIQTSPIPSMSFSLRRKPLSKFVPSVDSHEEVTIQTAEQDLNIVREILPMQSLEDKIYSNYDFDLIMSQHKLVTHTHNNFLKMISKAQNEFNETMLTIKQKLMEQVSIYEPIEQATSQQENKDYKGPNFKSILWDQKQLVTLASGKISSVFGPLFEQQDQYDIQCRMPEPPLLLAHRVMHIEGEPGSMGKGTVYTESDVHHDSWYLHNGRMPAGIFIESGQADLMLMSWLGVDFHNKGARAYRLLGCELTFHGDLPKPGDTLKYEIHVDGHAKQGDVLLFFFHYDCYVGGKHYIQVRNGQAGFFTKEELKNSRGVIWSPEEGPYQNHSPIPKPKIKHIKKFFHSHEIRAFCRGEVEKCFGPEYSFAQTHTRTPTYAKPELNFLHTITVLDIVGGPKERGYLKVECPVDPDEWFFKGHFKNDPCMPGTLMAEGCLQMMAFYLTALGYTLNRDGWRFEPIKETQFTFVCRGQVTPESKLLTYELFIDEIIEDPYPTIWGHTLCVVDGLKAFLTKRFGVRLVPDFPLSSRLDLLEINSEDNRPLATIGDFKLDYNSLINCALGNPKEAFGEGFPFVDYLRPPRLPGPPYHFMTRISNLSGIFGTLKAGAKVEALYDIPDTAWYFSENGHATMPFCVLMEIALQPCGWLATYVTFKSHEELLFRNLDGVARQKRDITPADKTIATQVELISISKAGSTIIERFLVKCFIEKEEVYSMETAFGYFPVEAMALQKGIAITPVEKKNMEQESNINIDLLAPEQDKYFTGSAKLPQRNSKLLMLDRITGFWPKGGTKGGNFYRAEKDVNVSEWFFKAHFYQDPVQPGSLGIEAMLQLLQYSMLDNKYEQKLKNPRFEPLFISNEIEWHYRGQVVPHNKLIVVDADIHEVIFAQGSVTIFAEARLWVDGIKIYHAPKIGMRLVEQLHL